MQITTLSAGMAAFAIACGGGTKAPATMPPAEGSVATKPATAESESPGEPHGRRNMKSLTPAELTWTPSDSGAGPKGPMMASLWGDTQSESKGMFIKLPSGDTGMLHSHGGVYRGVAITDAFDVAQAKLSNAPKAVEKTWKAATWIPFDENNPTAGAWAAVWGDSKSEPSGMYMKIPAGNAPFWHIHKADYHAVVLAGTLNNIESGSEAKDLPAGSYYMQPGGYKHTTNCKAGGPDCILYVYVTGAYDTKAM